MLDGVLCVNAFAQSQFETYRFNPTLWLLDVVSNVVG